MELDQLYLPSTQALPLEQRLWVRMRRKVKWGDEQAVESVIRAAHSIAGRGQAFHLMKRQQILCLVEAWNLHLTATGEVGGEGGDLPMVADSIDLLEPSDGDYLYEYAKHRWEAREDIANPFLPGSPASSPGSESSPTSEPKST